MQQVTLFCLALSFYTRLPTPHNLDYQQLPKACVYLPLVGWLVGGAVALAYILAALVLPQQSAVIIAIATGILMTGALHEDGVADVCDGFGGGYGKQRILAIMKDSQIGTYGAVGLLLLLFLKISLLSALPSETLPLILLAGYSISRLMPLLIMYRYAYARQDDSKAKQAVYKPHRKDLLFAAGIAVMPCLLLPKILLLGIVLMLLANVYLGRYFARHIGGYTGDCLGASQQLAELLYYTSVSALWTSI